MKNLILVIALACICQIFDNKAKAHVNESDKIREIWVCQYDFVTQAAIDCKRSN